MQTEQLPIPSHFDRDQVDKVWRVPYADRAGEASAWAAEHGIDAASGDERSTGLLLVDCQNTFCIPEFELFVAGRSGRGAVEDSVRLCEFIYRNLGEITKVICTMDTHTAVQIFHPIFWVNEEGEHPAGGQTVISLEDVEEGKWRVNPEVASTAADGDLAYLQRHALHYVRALSEREKYPLLVWPYHAMVGGVGHALVSAVEEAIFFHGVARFTQPRYEIKGRNLLTEHYSALGPEVLTGPDGEQLAEKNEALIEQLFEFDRVIVAGQAKSHCVAWTFYDLLDEIRARDESLAEKFYLLEDCTSPVVVPDGPDFTEQADEAFEKFGSAGMQIVKAANDAEWLRADS
ncbi:MAG: isochorismatase [Gemmatimonadetes bacterium]|uniref:Isochorismatase n=1 Tax=Candidatus Kutchimonas denitrificans TaxID=3056748 RepID=A0AAE4Z6W5_9BACT|nr:isochorismatase [Gemmatimonadota bacterium]NIR74113.1 isochorismatase [Candidatus Kutchimonas denitrificans]NIS01295.1 isochorismatase [Gemmatimonadota bacterium]NIT67026.1 isochorismatase [Gemmatimonadota bacterium]NIU51686.1 isochorismatase [Gemmatimonadota bacterium]